MARDLYGIPTETLLQKRREAQDQLMDGSQAISAGTADVNSTQQIILHARQRIREINAELMARGAGEVPADAVAPSDFTTVRFS